MLICAAIFTGGALVTVAEQPARLGLDDGAMLTQHGRFWPKANIGRDTVDVRY